MKIETRIIYEELRQPLKHIQWRVGSTTKDKTKGMALGYIDAREARARLDEVVGFNNWKPYYRQEGNKTICDLSIRIDGEWICKSDGAGDTEFEAVKGGISDSFKRACTCWGIGEYLYNLGNYNTWVEIEPQGKSYKIKKSEFDKLDKVLVELSKNKSDVHNEETYTQLQDNWVVKVSDCETMEDLLSVWEEVIERVKPYFTKKKKSSYFLPIQEMYDKRKEELNK